MLFKPYGSPADVSMAAGCLCYIEINAKKSNLLFSRFEVFALDPAKNIFPAATH